MTSDDIRDFWIRFNEKVIDLKSRIEQVIDATKISEFKMSLYNLQSLATDGTKFLPLYDVKRAQEEIESISKLLRKMEQKINPRRKFRFTTRNSSSSGNKNIEKNNITSTTLMASSIADDEAVNNSNLQKLIESGSRIFQNLYDTNVLLTKADLEHVESATLQILVTNCKKCIISIPFAIGSVRLECCEDCIILLGPCKTSVYLESCHKCTVFLSSHQLRIHTSTSCSMHVFCQSHPIIEDCNDMIFYPNRISYLNQSTDLKICGLILTEESLNSEFNEYSGEWNKVIDFRWHKNIPSPHWRIATIQEITSVNIPDIVKVIWKLKIVKSETSEIISSKYVHSKETELVNNNDDEI